MRFRKDKWIIPRNVVIDMLLGMQPFGRQMPLRYVPLFRKEKVTFVE